MTARRPARVALAAILVLAALLRLVFFVGLASGDPQDDGIYYGTAYTIYTQGENNLDRYRDPPAGWLPNPIDQFPLRPMVIYPVAAAFVVFGPGEASAALWGLICSLIVVLIVYRLGSLLHDRTVGLLAALLCAIYPLEVINATRILSDVQVGMFAALALLMVVEGDRRGSRAPYVLAGAAIAGAYLANARGLIVLLVLVTCVAGQQALSRERKGWHAPFLMLAGFAVVFAVEAAAYCVRVGDPLLSFHVQSGASYFKYVHEPVMEIDWGPLVVRYTNGEPLDLLRSVLGLTHRADQFGLFFVLFFASGISGLLKRRDLLLVMFAIGLLVYMEFGPVRLSFDWEAGKLDYMMVFKQDRFLLGVTAPFLVLSAFMLRSMARRSWIAAVAVLVMVGASSSKAIGETHAFYRAGLNDLRTLAPHVDANPEITFFGDHWAVEHLRIFTGHRAQNLRTLAPQTTAEELKGACVVLGGSRGVELLADYVESTLPPFARGVLASETVPGGWKLVEHVGGPRNAQRRHDAKLYCVE